MKDNFKDDLDARLNEMKQAREKSENLNDQKRRRIQDNPNSNNQSKDNNQSFISNNSDEADTWGSSSSRNSGSQQNDSPSIPKNKPFQNASSDNYKKSSSSQKIINSTEEEQSIPAPNLPSASSSLSSKRKTTPTRKKICRFAGCKKECDIDPSTGKYFAFCSKGHAKLHQEEEDLKMAIRMQAQEEEQASRYVPSSANHPNDFFLDDSDEPEIAFEDQIPPEEYFSIGQSDQRHDTSSHPVFGSPTDFEDAFPPSMDFFSPEFLQFPESFPSQNNITFASSSPTRGGFSSSSSSGRGGSSSSQVRGGFSFSSGRGGSSSSSSSRGARNGSRPTRTMIPASVLFQNFIGPTSSFFGPDDLFDSDSFYGNDIPPEISAALNNSNNPNSYEALLRLAELIGDVKPKGADQGIIESTTARAKITNAELQALQQDCKECVICKEEFHGGEDVRRLPCLHVFHTDCVDEWLKINKSCPICKLAIDDSAIAHIEADGSVRNLDGNHENDHNDYHNNDPHQQLE